MPESMSTPKPRSAHDANHIAATEETNNTFIPFITAIFFTDITTVQACSFALANQRYLCSSLEYASVVLNFASQMFSESSNALSPGATAHTCF